MGVEYYFVMKDKENMYALIVDLGKYFDKYVDESSIELIDRALSEIDEIFESSELSVEQKAIKDITVGELVDLIRIKRALEKIKYDSEIYSGAYLIEILKVYGLVKALTYWWKKENYEWSIVSEYDLYGDRFEGDKGVLQELRDEGFSIWFWGRREV